MILRMATAGDIDGIVALWDAAGIGLGGQVDAMEIQERLRRDPWLFVVAENDGMIVGSVMACYDGHRGLLKRVAVHPDRQGRGLGRALMEEAERRFLEAGITKLRLTAARENGAGLQFWAHLGYREVGEVAWLERQLDPDDPLCGAKRPWPDAWPDDWSERLAGAECPLCASLGQPHPLSLLVASGDVADVRLDRHSRFPGYCIVVWNRGHAVDPADLAPDLAGRYWSNVTNTGRVLKELFNPVKINYFTLGNTVPHLHTHVVPRYLDDPAAGGPIPWELIRSEEPTDTTVLESQAARIRVALADIAEAGS